MVTDKQLGEFGIQANRNQGSLNPSAGRLANGHSASRMRCCLAFHLPTNERKLQPKREIEEREVPVRNHKSNSQPLIPCQEQVIVNKERNCEVQREPARVFEMLSVIPVSQQCLPSHGEIEQRDSDNDHDLCPQVPLLVVFWEP